MLRKAFEGPVSIVSSSVTMSGHHPVVERKGGEGGKGEREEGREAREEGREVRKEGRKRKGRRGGSRPPEKYL